MRKSIRYVRFTILQSCLSLLLVSVAIAVQAAEIHVQQYSTTLLLPSLNQSVASHTINLPATIYTSFITLNTCSSSLVPNIFLSLDPTLSRPEASDLGDTKRNLTSGGLVLPGGQTRFHGNWKSKDKNVYQIVMEKGFGNWTGLLPDGAWMTVEMPIDVDGNTMFGDLEVELAVSTTGPVHSVSKTSVQLGDATSSQALLLSPLIQAYDPPQPSYPNYTLPGPALDIASYPFPAYTANANVSILLVPTSSSPTLDGLDYSLCAVRRAAPAAENNGKNSTTHEVVWRPGGFRWMSLVGGLSSETNYTAWFVDEDAGEGDGGRLAGPVLFTTKPDEFPCPLAHSLDICPGIAYTVPLEVPANGMPITILPDEYTDLLTANLQAFSTSLLVSACGRDLYSHVSSCADCYDSYRDWLCRTVLPQCTASSTSNSNTTAQTITRSPAVTRIEGLPNPPYEYTEFKPCLGVCNTVDRDCPAFLGFACPIRGITADKSYAFQGKEDEAEGLDGTGFYDGGTDQWGSRWCNGPMPEDV